MKPTMALGSAEQALAETIERAPLLEQVVAWANVNSGTTNLKGLAEMAMRLGDAFASLPGRLSLVEPGSIERVDADGRISDTTCGHHLVLSVRPDAIRRVLLTGHMDTVYPADHPFQTCEWIDPETLRGPGTADMKGGLVLMLAALVAFEQSKPKLGYDVLINSDEEIGSPSSSPVIRDLSAGKLAAFTYEPALPDGRLARRRPGSGNFAALVKGRSAHAGRNPQDGRNAVLAAADLALRLARSGSSAMTINPARIDGGSANNIVPDTAVLRFNVRPHEPQDRVAATDLLDRLVMEVASEHEVTIALHGDFGRPPKVVDDSTEKLFALVRQSAGALGEQLEWADTGGVCDGNNIAACGVPVIDTMGACGGAIHSAAEYLRVESLVTRARLSALVLHRIDSGAMSS